MNLLNLAFLAPVFMAWNTIKQSFIRFGSLLVVNGEVNGDIAHWLHVMLWSEWKVIPMGPKRHITQWHNIKSINGDTGPIVMSIFSGPVVFRKGRQVVIWRAMENSGKLTCFRGNVSYDGLVAEAAKRMYSSRDAETLSLRNKGSGFHLRRIQGENVAKITSDSLKTSGESPAGSGKLPMSADSDGAGDYLGSNVMPLTSFYPLVGRDRDDVGYSESMQPLQRHYVDPQMHILLQEAETWLTGVSWMRERGIAHRRGILLEGPPGTGKSSFVLAMAQHFGIPLRVVDLATCSDYDLPALRDYARTPGIFLFEDIDRVFEGSVNVTERQTDKVSFDAFLNLLSGTDALEGLIILTSNHPEKLDPALIRPGRVDRRVVVPLLTAEGRKAIAERVMRGCGEEAIAKLLEGAEDQPASHFENTCIQAAMKWFWEENLRHNTSTVTP